MAIPEFRVWDGEEMIYVSDSALWFLKIESSTEWGLYYKARLHCQSSSKTSLMQYTGMKDCEDEQIFERDILQDKEGTPGLVWWNPEKACYYLLSPNGDAVALSRKTINWKPWRVVGNVHETPKIVESNLGQLLRRLEEHADNVECPVCGSSDFVRKGAAWEELGDGEGPLLVNCNQCHHVMLFHVESMQ